MTYEINELASALAKAQGAMTGATKDAANPFYNSRYATLAACWEAIRRPFSENGLSVTQMVETDPELVRVRVTQKDRAGTPHVLEVDAIRVTVKTMLMHDSGQYLQSAFTAFSGDAGIQAVGSAISYMRRYALMATCGIAPDDDDGNAAQPQQGAPVQSTADGPLSRGAQRGADYLSTRPPSNGQDRQSNPADAVKAIETQQEIGRLTKKARLLKAAAQYDLRSSDIAAILAEREWPDNPKDLTEEHVAELETRGIAEYAARKAAEAGVPAVLPDGGLSVVGEYLTDPEEEVVA